MVFTGAMINTNIANPLALLEKYEQIAIDHSCSSDWVADRLFIDDGTGRDLWEDVSEMPEEEFYTFLGY